MNYDEAHKIEKEIYRLMKRRPIADDPFGWMNFARTLKTTADLLWRQAYNEFRTQTRPSMKEENHG